MRILFVGNYFLQRKGTKPIMETVAGFLRQDFNTTVLMTSRIQNRVMRMLDISWTILTSKYDLVFIDVFSGPSFFIAEWAAFALSVRSKKGNLILHGGRLAEFSEKNNDRIKTLFKKAGNIFTPSLYLKNHFETRGFSIQYLPNPININLFAFKANARINLDQPRILWVRAFLTIYNPEIAIGSIALLKKKYPRVKLTMVGPGGDLLQASVNLINSTDLKDNVVLAGPVPNDQLSKIYHDHDIFINTTSYESFGVALVEAAASGIPIVSTSVGEIPFIWKDQSEALLVKDLTPGELALKIDLLIRDDELRTRIIDNARKKAEQFSWENVKPHWRQLLQSTLMKN